MIKNIKIIEEQIFDIKYKNKWSLELKPKKEKTLHSLISITILINNNCVYCKSSHPPLNLRDIIKANLYLENFNLYKTI